jgi:CheY-like chemotaxis protein
VKHILVVDDEPPIREVIGDLLQDEGYNVAYAGSGSSMLKILEKEQPDLVLLDLMMPNGDGRYALQAMQTSPRWQSIPVIIVSGTGPYVLEGIKVPFLSKPFDLDQLLAAVNNALGAASDAKQ